LDWDCAAAIDIPALVSALKHTKQEGELPGGLVSKEDQNEVGESGVSMGTVERKRNEVHARLRKHGKYGRKIVIVDGFLLFGESTDEVGNEIELKILLRTTYQAAKQRREARKGYVTLEGFWEDPEGYVEKVVWPGYVDEHAFLFKNRDVEGEVDSGVVERLEIQVLPGEGCWNVEQMLEWVIEKIEDAL